MQEDEIDLRELFRTLVRHKIKIVLITLAVTISAIIYTLSKTPIYEVKSNIQIGYIGENLIVEPETLIKTLNIVFNVEDKIPSNGKFISEVTSISTNKNLKNFIEIRTEAVSNEEALQKNKEVLTYINESYKSKIEQYITETKNNIEDTKRAITNIDDFEIKNLQEQINLLKRQTIVSIDDKIKFLLNFKLNTIESKIDFHSKKLDEYAKEVDKLYKKTQNGVDASTVAISSIQMLNYQNLILNSQNAIEDLKTERQLILTETIPGLKVEKENIINEKIRKLQHVIDVELVSKKIALNEQITRLNYDISKHNIKPSELIGEYIVKDHPIKPKKSLIVTVAFVTGLILSIFFVFFLEFIRNEKSEI
jgi:LPS O-antigen subunit length determinant protein (WzzB/FepE family)